MMWFFQGLERMRLIVTCELIAKSAAVVATFALVRGPQDDWKVLGLQGAASTLSLLVSLVLAWREVGARIPTRKLVWEALQRSLPTFIPRNASVFFTIGNAFLLGLFAPPNMVGYYAGADRIARAVYGLLAPASEAVYPRIIRVARHSRMDARRLARLAFVLVGAVGLVMTGCLFLMAPYLVRAILGPGFEPAVLLLRVFSILPPIIALRNILGIHWMLPLDLERELNAIVLGGGLVNIVLALLIAPRLGGLGMAWVVIGSQAAASLGTYLVLRRMRLDPFSDGAAPPAEANPEAYIPDGVVER